MRPIAGVVLGMATLLAFSILAQSGARASSTRGVDAPALPVNEWSGRLSEPRPEFPPPLDSDARPDRCTVCRLAAATTGKLPVTAFHIEGSATLNGAALRLVSTDPAVREALWQATVARGELLSALRSGADLELCPSCRDRRATLADLDISAQRIPQGVLLVYTSSSPAVVQQIHTVVDAGRDGPLRF